MTSEFKSHKSYREFAFSVRQCWRYLPTEDDKNFIEAVLWTSQGKGKEEPPGQTIWRAQVGHALRDWATIMSQLPSVGSE